MNTQVEAAIRSTVQFLEVAFYGLEMPTALNHDFAAACENLDHVATLTKRARNKLANQEYGCETLKDLHWSMIDADLMVSFAGPNAYMIEGKAFDLHAALRAAGAL